MFCKEKIAYIKLFETFYKKINYVQRFKTNHRRILFQQNNINVIRKDPHIFKTKNNTNGLILKHKVIFDND